MLSEIRASDLIERIAHGGSETRSGAIPAGVFLRAVLRGRILGGGLGTTREKDPLIDSAWAARHVEERADEGRKRGAGTVPWRQVRLPGARLTRSALDATSLETTAASDEARD